MATIHGSTAKEQWGRNKTPRINQLQASPLHSAMHSSSSNTCFCSCCQPSSHYCYVGQQLIFNTLGPILTHLSQAVKTSSLCHHCDNAAHPPAFAQISHCNLYRQDPRRDPGVLRTSSCFPSAHKSNASTSSWLFALQHYFYKCTLCGDCALPDDNFSPLSLILCPSSTLAGPLN